MTTFAQILLIILAVFLIWQMYRFVRNNPGMFSKINIERSMFTLGALCLALIGFVALLVWLLKI